MQYSIRVTLQRTTTEYINIDVPLDNDLLQPKNADGTANIDGEKVLAKAVQIGSEVTEGWKPEHSKIDVHPTQGLYAD